MSEQPATTLPPTYPWDGSTPPERARPKPGIRHVLLFLPSLLVFGVFLTGAVAAVVVALANPGITSDSVAFTEALQAWLLSGPGLMLGMLSQALAFLVPVLVAGRLHEGGWRGLVRWKFNWRQDLLIAVVAVLVLRSVEYAVNLFLTSVKEVDVSKLGNGDLLESAGGYWIIAMGAFAVILAPLMEELFFRGLTLRVVGERFGVVTGVIVSSMFFGLLHGQGSWESLLYMGATTGVVGAVFAVLVLRTNRLGTSLVAHALFNGSAVIILALRALWSALGN